MEQYLPVLTAGLTLANTIFLFLINRRTTNTHQRVDGLLLQHTAESEERGRRLERHAASTERIGE